MSRWEAAAQGTCRAACVGHGGCTPHPQAKKASWPERGDGTFHRAGDRRRVRSRAPCADRPARSRMRMRAGS